MTNIGHNTVKTTQWNKLPARNPDSGKMSAVVHNLSNVLHLIQGLQLLSCRVYDPHQACFCWACLQNIRSLKHLHTGLHGIRFLHENLGWSCTSGSLSGRFCAVVTSMPCSMRAILRPSSRFCRCVLQSFQACSRQPACTCELNKALLWLHLL